MLTFCYFLEKLFNHYTVENVWYVKFQRLKITRKHFFTVKIGVIYKIYKILRYDVLHDLVSFVQF